MSQAASVRHYELPGSWSGRLWVWRYIVLRRVIQIGVLLLFAGTLRWGWEIAGRPLLRGDLSASEILGTIPLADPLATLQMLAAGASLQTTVLVGALIVLAVFTLFGGRTFCSWVCPVNPVTDLAAWLGDRLGLKRSLHVRRRLRYWVLGSALVLSALMGVAAFEWVSPIGVLHRGLIYGMGFGWAIVAALFLFDLLAVKHGWCGHVCPLGAFYGLLGRAAQVRVAFDASSCTHCGDCMVVCPEPQVLNLKQAALEGMISSGDCTNCGRCTPICPEGSLRFDLRARVARDNLAPRGPAARRTG